MRLELITNDVVEGFLRCLRNGEKSDTELLNLSALNPNTHSPVERNLELANIVGAIIEGTYLDLRRAEMLNDNKPRTRPESMAQIREDFACGNSSLEAWSTLYFRYIGLLPMTIEEISAAAIVVPQQLRRRINLGLSALTQRIQHLEVAAMQKQAATEHLPLPDSTRLVNTGVYLQQLSRLFSQADGPKMVSLEGIGGIGKTALARAFVSLPETLQQWKKILWVSARQTFFDKDGQISVYPEADLTLEDISTRLAKQLGLAHLAEKPLTERLEGIGETLKSEHCLVVIDNLETAAELVKLIPVLAKYVGNSRILITTRKSLQEYDYVHTVPVTELSRQDSFDLLQIEISRLGKVKKISESDCELLYQVIGGIPLATKLVAAQLFLRPLNDILKGFQQARNETQNLYRFIYWQTWQMLSKDGQHLLLSFLPSDPEGEDPAFLLMMSSLKEGQFYQALAELNRFSLLEIGGDIARPRYKLHRLTVTFLQTDILNSWSEPTHDERLPDSG